MILPHEWSGISASLCKFLYMQQVIVNDPTFINIYWMSSDFWKLIKKTNVLCTFEYRVYYHSLQHKSSKSSVIFKNMLANQFTCFYRSQSFSGTFQISKQCTCLYLMTTHPLNSFALVWHLAIKSGMYPLQLMKSILVLVLKQWERAKDNPLLVLTWVSFRSHLCKENKLEKLFHFLGKS